MESWWWRRLSPPAPPWKLSQPFVASEKLPGNAVTKSALKNLDGLAGKVTAVDLLPGEQLVAEPWSRRRTSKPAER